ncbi:MAG: excinuclease ABC subunit C [Thermoplasmata archaeon]|nr:excinuclease ABC subunit C [Thermoplasmata archaeon]MCK4455923.1 excinuclease ABC subunit C [Thermoplasmata archaeon]
MAIPKKWTSFNKKNVSGVVNVYGAYELGDRSGEVIYIGEGRLRDRLMSHFSNGSDPIPGTARYRYEQTSSKERAVSRQNALLREFKRKYGRLPFFNQRRRG